MKKLLLTLFLFLGISLLLPSQTKGQENWKISNFRSDLEIGQDGVLSVVETIKVDFGSGAKHGIFRDIPYIYQNEDKSKTYLEIGLKSITRNNTSEKFSESKSSGNLSIKIGDENKTIVGEHTYVIRYTVAGALLGYEGFDELYWNVTGNYWEVVIDSAQATVKLPKEGIMQSSCYQGVSGSTEKCQSSEVSKTEYLFESTRKLGGGEGLTIAIGFEKGLVPLLVGKAPRTIVDDLFKPVNLVITLLTFFIGLFFVINLWLQKGRDMWFGRNYLFGTKAERVPAGAKETIVVEYSPPDNLRPAQLAGLIDEKADTLDVTATIIDLANRGYLSITEEAKKWIFGDKDYIFERSSKNLEGLMEYEKELIERLFDEKNTVKMSELKNKFYKDLAAVKESLHRNLTEKKFFPENPNKVRVRYSLFAIFLGIFGGSLVWFAISIVNSLWFELGAVLILLAIIFLIVAQFMPARSALGRQMFARAKGYELFIATAEKHRQKFFEQKNLFNEILPYAIVFGLTDKFAKAFEKMGLQAQQPGWYHSSSVFNAAAFGSSMNSFSKTMTTSIASSPSSSGSGGGGSSGGGFGGGGGGSW